MKALKSISFAWDVLAVAMFGLYLIVHVNASIPDIVIGAVSAIWIMGLIKNLCVSILAVLCEESIFIPGIILNLLAFVFFLSVAGSTYNAVKSDDLAIYMLVVFFCDAAVMLYELAKPDATPTVETSEEKKEQIP
jgi:hypothetical protein